jgi:opacity protein-like surface antigen
MRLLRADRLALLVATATVAFISAPTSAAAQSSTTRGLSLGLYLQGASLEVEGGDPGSGGGGGLRVGYGFNRIVTGFVRFDGSKTDIEDATVEGQWTLGHAEIGARFHFANSLRRWVPWLEAAAGGRAVSVSDAVVEGEQETADVTFSGGAFSLGGGLDVYLSQNWALDVGLAWTSGEFNEIEVGAISASGLDIDAQSFRFNVGVAWWP